MGGISVFLGMALYHKYTGYGVQVTCELRVCLEVRGWFLCECCANRPFSRDDSLH
jgi:hypothetical protein